MEQVSAILRGERNGGWTYYHVVNPETKTAIHFRCKTYYESSVEKAFRRLQPVVGHSEEEERPINLPSVQSIEETPDAGKSDI